jgi:tetratricopeptide (TPR) repeat protein
MQNFLLIWLDANINESDGDFQNAITHVRRVIDALDIFTDADRCVGAITEIEDETIFVIVSGALGQKVIPIIHPIPQVDSVFVFCDNMSWHQQWAKNWPKVKGVFNEIVPICQALQEAARRCDQYLISMSFVAANRVFSADENSDKYDQSFMYTQLFKQILLNIDDYDARSIKQLAAYCRYRYTDNKKELEMIAKFEQDYSLETPIWWYTSDCFLRPMLNRALRVQEVDTILKMSFFIHDLHGQIKKLHREQSRDNQKPFSVYRGQGLFKADFEKLMQTEGGLMSFDNFLFACKDETASIDFARRALTNLELNAVIFVIAIDPAVSSVPFALLDNISYYKESKQEVLFSMQTIFHVGEIKQIDADIPLWQVKLSLPEDKNPQLRALTARMEAETSQGSEGWYRLSELLLTVGEYDQAELVLKVLLDQPSDDEQRAYLYQKIGYIKCSSGESKAAIPYYEKSIAIKQRVIPPNQPSLVISYNSLGSAYLNMGEFSKALLFYNEALAITKKIRPSTHPSVASAYYDIGAVYFIMKEYSKAASFYRFATEIGQQSLPPNHPDLQKYKTDLAAATKM